MYLSELFLSMFTNEVGENDKTAMSSVLRYFEVGGYPVDELFGQRIVHFPETKYTLDRK